MSTQTQTITELEIPSLVNRYCEIIIDNDLSEGMQTKTFDSEMDDHVMDTGRVVKRRRTDSHLSQSDIGVRFASPDRTYSRRSRSPDSSSLTDIINCNDTSLSLFPNNNRYFSNRIHDDALPTDIEDYDTLLITTSVRSNGGVHFDSPSGNARVTYTDSIPSMANDAFDNQSDVFMSNNSGYARPMVVLSNLSDGVPNALKRKICMGKYVDMRELVELNKPSFDESSRLAVQMGYSGASILVYLPNKKKPLSHPEYSNGWRMYKAVYLQAHPEEVNAMLTFENDVCNLAIQGLDWLRYDEEFKRSKESHGYPWNTICPDLDRMLYSSLGYITFSNFCTSKATVSHSGLSSLRK